MFSRHCFGRNIDQMYKSRYRLSAGESEVVDTGGTGDRLGEPEKDPLRFESLEVTSLEQSVTAERVKNYDEVRLFQLYLLFVAPLHIILNQFVQGRFRSFRRIFAG